MAKQEENKSNGKGVLIGIVALLAVGNVGQFAWKYFSDEEKQQVITKTEEKVDSLSADLKSTLAEITQLEADIQAAIEEKTKLGQDVSELQGKLETLEKEKAYFKANFQNPKVRREMEDKIVNYEAMLKQQEDEIRGLRAKNDSLYKYNGELKTVIVSKEDSLFKLGKINEEQLDLIKKGKVLSAAAFKVTAIKNVEKNKTVYEPTQVYRNKDIVQAQLDFEISANPIADIEEKSIYVQILDPSKGVLFDNSKGGGSFETASGTKNYSVKQNIMYNQSKKSMSLIWDKTADLVVGAYQVRVWCEGEMIGSGAFTVK